MPDKTRGLDWNMAVLENPQGDPFEQVGGSDSSWGYPLSSSL